MRPAASALIAVLTTLAAPAAAGALTWSGPFAVPPGDPPVAAIPAPDGDSTLLIRGTRLVVPGLTSGTEALTAQRVSGTGRLIGVPARLAGALLIRDRPRPDGGDDLLVSLPGGREAIGAGRLALLRAGADGRLRTLWRSPHTIANPRADVARNGAGRFVIAWPQRNGVKLHINVVTSADGRHFTAPRALRSARRGLPLELTSFESIGVAVGPGGAPIVAVAQSAAGGSTVVLQARRDDVVTRRQTFAGATGLLTTEQTPGGRIGLVIHNTGIEGEWGECVGDGRPRKVYATSAEPRSGRFHGLQQLNEQQAFCPDGGAPRIFAGAHDQLVLAFGAIADGQRSSDVRVAWSSPGHGFGLASTIWPGVQLAGIAADPRAGTLVAALQGPDPQLFGPGQGVSIAARAPDGAMMAPQQLDTTGRLGTLAVGPDGRTVVTVQARGRDEVTLFTAR